MHVYSNFFYLCHSSFYCCLFASSSSPLSEYRQPSRVLSPSAQCQQWLSYLSLSSGEPLCTVAASMYMYMYMYVYNTHVPGIYIVHVEIEMIPYCHTASETRRLHNEEEPSPQHLHLSPWLLSSRLSLRLRLQLRPHSCGRPPEVPQQS